MTAFSNPYRSAARRAETPLAVATATKRSKPAARKAGSSVPAENAPAPIQPTPGRPGSARLVGAAQTDRLVRAGRGRISQANRQAGLGPFLEQPVRLARAVNAERLGDQVRYLEPPGSKQVEHRLLVPALGPAVMPRRKSTPQPS